MAWLTKQYGSVLVAGDLPSGQLSGDAPDVSDDGNQIVFMSSGIVYLFVVSSGELVAISTNPVLVALGGGGTNPRWPTISGDGSAR
ncbi:hypothetical protein [Granulosicoccus antarcticus]|uniref:Uncharacterized protein n=1 Tax=Granulosicoccus antarcticus IMCC3135 TaxID=1192854 RepID=A0A2Z2NXU6_9GAMM|nr:hypothetical protein [Granulosicoccus antarcticus]ASJ74578.1 hypothetical protein IMCC3135_22540 [Granulosicoccus antarcticus IMCC3135]